LTDGSLQAPWVEEAKKRLEDAQAALKPPHEQSLAATLLTDARQELHIDRLGDAVGDRVSLDDPTVEPGHEYTLARQIPRRHTPAAWQPIALPDPFEHHNAVSFDMEPEAPLPLPSVSPKK
jgi:hypothetical protein